MSTWNELFIDFSQNIEDDIALTDNDDEIKIWKQLLIDMYELYYPKNVKYTDVAYSNVEELIWDHYNECADQCVKIRNQKWGREEVI